MINNDEEMLMDLLILNYYLKYEILALSQLGKGKCSKTVFSAFTLTALGVAAGHTGLHGCTDAGGGHFTSTFGP